MGGRAVGRGKGRSPHLPGGAPARTRKVPRWRTSSSPRLHDLRMLILTTDWKDVNTNDANGRAVRPAGCLEYFLDI